jgi:hypothetical protein
MNEVREGLWIAASVCGCIDDCGEATVGRDVESGLQDSALNS